MQMTGQTTHRLDTNITVIDNGSHADDRAEKQLPAFLNAALLSCSGTSISVVFLLFSFLCLVRTISNYSSFCVNPISTCIYLIDVYSVTYFLFFAQRDLEMKK